MRQIFLIYFLSFFSGSWIAFGQTDSSHTVYLTGDSLADSSFSALDFTNPQLHFQTPDSLSIRFEAPKRVTGPNYYDPKKVIPDNPLELDYRESSYYTPRIVSDKLDHIMNRPRSDSFVPILPLAYLAASVALQMIDLDFSSPAAATDYLKNQQDLAVLIALWKQSPQTVKELLEHPLINASHSYNTLERLLDDLSRHNLVKRKIIEKGPTQYFPAQKKEEVLLALKNAHLSKELTAEEKTAILQVTHFIEEAEL